MQEDFGLKVIYLESQREALASLNIENHPLLLPRARKAKLLYTFEQSAQNIKLGNNSFTHALYKIPFLVYNIKC